MVIALCSQSGLRASPSELRARRQREQAGAVRATEAPLAAPAPPRSGRGGGSRHVRGEAPGIARCADGLDGLDAWIP